MNGKGSKNRCFFYPSKLTKNLQVALLSLVFLLSSVISVSVVGDPPTSYTMETNGVRMTIDIGSTNIYPDSPAWIRLYINSTSSDPLELNIWSESAITYSGLSYEVDVIQPGDNVSVLVNFTRSDLDLGTTLYLEVHLEMHSEAGVVASLLLPLSILVGTGDSDNDGIPDEFDNDDDDDGYPDEMEERQGTNPFDPKSIPLDKDGDFTPDSEDPFPDDPTQCSDSDGDGYGDNIHGTNPDFFPADPNEWIDNDRDGWGDNNNDSFPQDIAAHLDSDGDGYPDEWNPGQVAENSTSSPPLKIDVFPNIKAIAVDDDMDGYPDEWNKDIDPEDYPSNITLDIFPDDESEWSDLDGDGIGDNSDMDTDGDGWNNTVEESAGSDPLDRMSLPRDTDGDGEPDVLDDDNDNDGYPNRLEERAGSNPFDPDSIPPDFDGDGIPDVNDKDDDNDGVNDHLDQLPYNKEEWQDMDNDGLGDNKDGDKDGDGVPNDIDDFPTDPNRTKAMWRSLSFTFYQKMMFTVFILALFLCMYMLALRIKDQRKWKTNRDEKEKA